MYKIILETGRGLMLINLANTNPVLAARKTGSKLFKKILTSSFKRYYPRSHRNRCSGLRGFHLAPHQENRTEERAQRFH